MPSIDRESARSEEWRKLYELNRYVRIGETIYYDENYRRMHSQIATKNGALMNKEGTRPVVQDAGELRIRDGKLAFTGTTSSCDIEGDVVNARVQTYELAVKQFGADIIAPIEF